MGTGMKTSIAGRHTAAEFRQEYLSIASWWINYAIDTVHGGFHGEVGPDNSPRAGADKGVILNCRILWFFSELARIEPVSVYREVAQRAYQYLIEHFWDREYGGVFWMVDSAGNLVDGRKHSYAQSFFIYGLSAYYELTGDEAALDTAMQCYQLLERHALDTKNNGYFEAASRSWGKLQDVRLSEKEDNFPKTMNTHLHVLEGYTALHNAAALRQERQSVISTALQNVLEVYCERIVDIESGHTRMFFSESWKDFSSAYSFGHDIESSWLIHKAISSLCHQYPQALRYMEHVKRLASVASAEGILPNGGMGDVYDWHSKSFTRSCWWVQAEAMVGLANMWTLGEGENYLEAALKVWEHIQESFIDSGAGEWYWSNRHEHDATVTGYKAGAWKAPYHNGRATMLMYRILLGGDFCSPAHRGPPDR